MGRMGPYCFGEMVRYDVDLSATVLTLACYDSSF